MESSEGNVEDDCGNENGEELDDDEGFEEDENEEGHEGMLTLQNECWTSIA